MASVAYRESLESKIAMIERLKKVQGRLTPDEPVLAGGQNRKSALKLKQRFPVRSGKRRENGMTL